MTLRTAHPNVRRGRARPTRNDRDKRGRCLGAALGLLAACGSPAPAPVPEPSQTVVRVGLQRVGEGAVSVLAGKRVGLIVHAASVTAEGRHAIDVLRDAGVEVVRLFAPEHGLRSRAAAGEQIADDRDPVSGLPVVSLYDEHRQPQAGDLEGLDALVFDLQGAGVRFYTYVSTLILAVEAAAEAGIEMVVLDRPNPLGGRRIEGPLSAPRDVVPASFVNMAPGPLVHGMTMGEMARLVNDRLPRPAALEVVTMEGWRRDMVWTDTGLPWVPPSPNLRTAEAAFAYPGVALLEATNVSEGRGTAAPFLRFGAPWLAPEVSPLPEPGFVLRPITFTPRSSPAAPAPKHVAETCNGFAVRVTDAHEASAYRLGIGLLHQLQHEPGFAWRDGDDALTWLLGTPRVYEQLTSDADVEAVLAADVDDHQAWRDARRPYLLYHQSDRTPR